MNKALQYLEKLSRERPADAIRRAETMVLEVEDHLVPKVLAICGTAYRRLERHDDAMHVLLDAEELAEDLPTLADVKRRIAYAIGAQGNFKRAIEEIHKAQNLFLLAGDLPGVGRAMIDQGMQLFHQEELELAGQYLERSLDFIEPDVRSTDSLPSWVWACALRNPISQRPSPTFDRRPSRPIEWGEPFS